MKKHILILLPVIMLSCNQSEKSSEIKNEDSAITNTNPDQLSKTDINGKWVITDVTGGPLKVYPNGKSSPGMDVDLKTIWAGGYYEFMGGVAFLNIPNVTKEEVGNYSIDNNTIIFENNKDEKQSATIEVKKNMMTLSFDPLMYRETLMKNSQGAMDVEIPSAVVFHLKKE